MKILLIILGIYIGMVILSLLGPYVDFKKDHCKDGVEYTLEDLYKGMDEALWVLCFIPVFNIMTVILSLVYFLVLPLWNKIKNIRII